MMKKVCRPARLLYDILRGLKALCDTNATSNMISPHLTYKLRWVADKTSVKNTFKFNCLQTAIRGKGGKGE